MNCSFDFLHLKLDKVVNHKLSIFLPILRYQGGMPIGNGDVSVLAWANMTNNGVSFYLQKQDSVSKDGTPWKMGLIHIKTDVKMTADKFNQTLDLQTATFILSWGKIFLKNKFASFCY